MSDIREFLLAQWAAEEALVRRVADRYRIRNPVRDDDGQSYWPLPSVRANFRGGVDADIVAGLELIEAFSPARVLAEVAAKRRILARHRLPTDEEVRGEYGPVWRGACIGCGFSGPTDDPRTDSYGQCPELLDLASPYRDMPGWQPEWEVTE